MKTTKSRIAIKYLFVSVVVCAVVWLFAYGYLGGLNGSRTYEVPYVDIDLEPYHVNKTYVGREIADVERDLGVRIVRRRPSGPFLLRGRGYGAIGYGEIEFVVKDGKILSTAYVIHD